MRCVLVSSLAKFFVSVNRVLFSFSILCDNRGNRACAPFLRSAFQFVTFRDRFIESRCTGEIASKADADYARQCRVPDMCWKS